MCSLKIFVVFYFFFLFVRKKLHSICCAFYSQLKLQFIFIFLLFFYYVLQVRRLWQGVVVCMLTWRRSTWQRAVVDIVGAVTDMALEWQYWRH